MSDDRIIIRGGRTGAPVRDAEIRPEGRREPAETDRGVPERERDDPFTLRRPAAATPVAADTNSDRLKRTLLIGSAVAVALAVTAGLLLAPSSRDRTEPTRTAAAPVVQPQRAETARRYSVTTEGYQAPSAEPVSRALQRVRADYAAGGASNVVRASQGCFDQLAAQPSYGRLDECLAYDQFGNAIISRLSGGGAPAADTWFGGTEARGRQAAQAVMGGQGDADARVLDIRRLSLAATQRTSAPVQTARTAPPIPAPVQVAKAESAPSPAVAQERVTVSRASPGPDASPASRPQPVAKASTPAARPSFNCRYARSASERLVCSDPVLAAADWRLHNVFERAMAETGRSRALRAEQDRWLAEREAAAPDSRDVLAVYEARIDELASR